MFFVFDLNIPCDSPLSLQTPMNYFLCVEVGVDIVESQGHFLNNLETVPCTNHSHFELGEKKFYLFYSMKH
jgi:hypothetical protein